MHIDDYDAPVPINHLTSRVHINYNTTPASINYMDALMI